MGRETRNMMAAISQYMNSPNPHLEAEMKRLQDPSNVYMGRHNKTLEDYIGNSLRQGMPGKDQIVQQGTANINRNTSNAIMRSNEDMASKGMFKSGISGAVNADIYGQGARAQGEFMSNIAEKEAGFRQQAIYQLLGLNNTELNQLNQNKNMALGLKDRDMAQRQFMANMYAQSQTREDSEPDPFMQFLGALLGAGTQVGSAAIIAKGNK